MPKASLPPELQILLASARDEQRSSAWQRARFLESSFEDDVWTCRFQGCADLEINFHVRLGAGHLTDKRHSNLLTAFKGWICAQDHPASNRAGNVSPTVKRRRVEHVLRIIDYLLLNSKALQLEEHGLAAITRSDIYVLFHRLASTSEVAEGVYQWTERLTIYLRAAASTLSEVALETARTKCPNIENGLPKAAERVLLLDRDELIRARAYLLLNQLTLNRGSRGHAINCTRISERLYKNTLCGMTVKPIPPELVFHNDLLYYRELPSAPTRNFDVKPRSDKSLGLYNSALSALSLVPASIHKASPDAIAAWESNALLSTFKVSTSDRTRNVPVPIALKALRDAIEFVINHGNDIVDAFVSLATAAHESGKNCCSYAWQCSITDHLSEHLKAMGVDRWMIENCEKRTSVEAHFNRLRTAPTLLELLNALVGACAVVVSTLMARRKGELSDLTAETALDETRRYLIFFNRKSGPMGLRARERRPIPSIAAECIELLKKMQESAKGLGLLGESARLFQAPFDTGEIGKSSDSDTLYRSIDLFCDFVQVGVDGKGRRFYLRPHQLRRLFAMLFFWRAGFGQMDTLRWFLGHTDIEHLYRYITESIPGQAMDLMKADYALEVMAAGDEEAEQLLQVVRSHFEVSSVSVLDQDELHEYVTDLLSTGAVEIEPVFLSNGCERSFRVAIKVTPGVLSCR